MTRINCVPPSELSTKHLVAEYRELPRVFTLVYEAILRGERPDDPRNPTAYTLGQGHVRFFYPRLGYASKRLYALVDEMLARGYKPQHLHPPAVFDQINRHWCADWTPTPEALAINRARIAERTKP